MDNLPHPPSAICIIGNCTAAGRPRARFQPVADLAVAAVGRDRAGYLPHVDSADRISSHQGRGSGAARDAAGSEFEEPEQSVHAGLSKNQAQRGAHRYPARSSTSRQRVSSAAAFSTASRSTLEEEGEASGLIVDADGYIVTNYHVVEETSEVNVVLYDGRGPSGGSGRLRSGHRFGRA